MSELSLESLARRLEEVKRRLNEKQPSITAPTKDWRRVVGISEDNDHAANARRDRGLP
jgi:hypothetical protein